MMVSGDRKQHQPLRTIDWQHAKTSITWCTLQTEVTDTLSVTSVCNVLIALSKAMRATLCRFSREEHRCLTKFSDEHIYIYYYMLLV